MQIVDFLIALLPALFWGSVVIIHVFVGGGPYNQIRGTTLGTLFIGFSLLATGHAAFDNLTVIIVGLVSGALWAFGQGNQLKSVHLIGISLTSLKAKSEGKSDNPEFKKAMGILLLSTIGYVGYVVLGDIFGVSGTDALFFQSIGMAIGGLILSMNHNTSIKSTALNLIPGVIWGIGNLFMFYSQPKVGVATSFSLSQLLVIVSTLGGIFILGEKKDRRQMIGIWSGIIVIVIASIILGNLK